MKQPHLLVEPGDCHETALLPGDPGRVDAIAAHLDDTETVAEHREYRLVNGRYEGTPVTVCSTGIGCPSAAVAVEELAKVGVERFLRVGTTGALQPGMANGELVVATAAAKFEGTTKRYEDVAYPAAASPDVVSAVRDAAEGRGTDVHVGPVVTDDAFYAEGDVAEDWSEAGMLSVEMEAAAIFALARRRGLAAGAILAVDGNLVEGSQKGESEEGGLPDDAAEGVEREIAIALDAAAALE
jgi:uridine phosphorylase